MAASTVGFMPDKAEAGPPLINLPPRSFAEVVSGNHGGEVQASPRAFSKSFASVLNNGGSIHIKKPGLYRGEPAIFFSKDEISKLASPFRFCLVGKFSFKRPPMEIIRKFFTSLGLKSLKSVGLMQDNHVIIFINNEDDYSRLLLKATWYVAGLPMKVFKWSPEFFPSYESPVVPVWVALPGLPLHFFDKSVLFSLASALGNPLKVDEATAILSRPSVARVCIDIDVSKEKFNRLWIGDEKDGFWQEVVYENLQPYCGFCSKLGHEEFGCYVKNPDLKVPKEKTKKEEGKPVLKHTIPDMVVEVGAEVTHSKNKENSASPVDAAEGDWQLQKSKKWRRKEHSDDIPVVVAPSTAAKVVVPRTGVALTPFNSKFVAPSKCSTVCKNGKSSSVVPAQKFQPSVSVVRELQNPLFPSTLPAKSNLPSTSHISQSTSDTTNFTATSSSSSMLHTQSGVVKSNLKLSQPLIFPVNNALPSIGLQNQLSPKCGTHVHLCETSDKRNLQEHVLMENEKDTLVCISSSCTSRLKKLDPLVSVGNDLFQPLMEGKEVGESFFQPSLITSGVHNVLCGREINCEAHNSSLPCASGPHALDNHPLIDPKLHLQPSNCLEFERVNTFQPPLLNLTLNGEVHNINGDTNIVSRGDEVSLCGINLVPSILEEFGPDSSQELSHSTGPVLVDDMLGPNAIIVVNPKGQVDNKNEGFNRSQNFLAHGSKVTLPFNINHIQSLLLSFLADHGVVVRPPLHKALVEFSTILENSFDDSWEISWLFFQENLFRFFRSSEVTIPKKTRRILKFFFQVATEKNWPLFNTKGKMPVVKDGISDTDEST